MTTKLWQWQKIALLSAGISASMASVAWGGTAPLYQLHLDGSIWQYTGVPCSEGFCPGWQLLDNNPATVEIAAGGGHLYQIHAPADSSVWEFTGQLCNANSCPGWVQIANFDGGEPPGMDGGEMIAAANGTVVVQSWNGALWQFTGQPCNSNATSCPGWVEIDNNPSNGNFVVGGAGLLEQSSLDDSIWLYTGVPCAGNSCAGWKQIDGNPNTFNPKCQYQVPYCSMTSGEEWIYQLWSDGAIWQYLGPPCDPACGGWRQMDNNPNTKQITAGNFLYEIHNDGSIWQSSGAPCNGGYCTGWWQIDNNPAAEYIVAGPSTVYQQHTDGSIWQYVGPICNGGVCSGWIELDNNWETFSIVPGFASSGQSVGK